MHLTGMHTMENAPGLFAFSNEVRKTLLWTFCTSNTHQIQATLTVVIDCVVWLLLDDDGGRESIV